MNLKDSIETVTQQVNDHFLPLDNVELNWKPDIAKWSIGQCLDHIMVSNTTYFPTFEKVLNGSYQLSFLQKLNPFKKTFGPMMIRSLGPVAARKFTAPRDFEPSLSAIRSNIVDLFKEHQQTLVTYFAKLEKMNTSSIVIASPVSGLITYSLADALQIIAGHEQRHVNQAINVLNHPNFPRS